MMRRFDLDNLKLCAEYGENTEIPGQTRMNYDLLQMLYIISGWCEIFRCPDYDGLKTQVLPCAAL